VGGYLTPAFLAWVIAQILKVVLTSAHERRLNLRVLAETGGMPSSHAAIVMGLTAAVGRLNGLTSAAFAIALIFSIVVMYDAQGVRRAAGRQAAVLNRLVDDMVSLRPITDDRLRELLGHTPFEVLVGAALGIAVGLLPF
jgi:acid phosphatase family membrane protein YuiD